MNDLRQGVTETQHAVLDLIEERAAEWSERMSWGEKLVEARGTAADAVRAKTLKDVRLAAIVAAALLIDAADEIGRLIGIGNSCPDCGDRYDGTDYFCLKCTTEKIEAGGAPHDVRAGR